LIEYNNNNNLLLDRSQNATNKAATQDSGTCTNNQCWLEGQVHLVTTRFSTGE